VHRCCQVSFSCTCCRASTTVAFLLAESRRHDLSPCATRSHGLYSRSVFPIMRTQISELQIYPHHHFPQCYRASDAFFLVGCCHLLFMIAVTRTSFKSRNDVSSNYEKDGVSTFCGVPVWNSIYSSQAGAYSKKCTTLVGMKSIN
jgi:hypothetical protein